MRMHALLCCGCKWHQPLPCWHRLGSHTTCLDSQDVVAPFNFTGKFNLSAIRKIYSSLLWHFEQVRAAAAAQEAHRPGHTSCIMCRRCFGGIEEQHCHMTQEVWRACELNIAAYAAHTLPLLPGQQYEVHCTRHESARAACCRVHRAL